MDDLLLCGTAALLTALCLIQGVLNARADAALTQRSCRPACPQALRTVLLTVLLLSSVPLRAPLPIVSLVFWAFTVLPYCKVGYALLSMQSIKTILFMSTLLTLDSVLRIIQLFFPQLMLSAWLRMAGLCLAQGVATLFTAIFAGQGGASMVQDNDDTDRHRVFSRFVWFCALYLFLDSLLCLMAGDSLFVPVAVIFGSALIFALLVAAYHYNDRLRQQAQVEQEYLLLEKERAMQRWQAQKLQQLAQKDTLTGAYSRRYMTDRLAELDAAHVPYALAYIDMDEMKQINDTKGHEAGDAYLCGFVQALCAQLPAQAFLARMGGDEFVAVFPGADKSVAQQTMLALSARLTRYAYSYGVADAGQLQSADRMMYAEKQAKKRRQP